MFPPSNFPSFLFQHILEAQERSGRVYEAVIGVVTDNKDPDKYGRVKVKYPHLGEETSWWAPVMSLGAGKERGWFFLPEVDDEVVVMFEHGDIHRPVILGALWNGKDSPPDSNGGKNERKVIVSREGSKITFDDDKGTVTLEDGGGIGTIEISKENTIKITAAQGDVCVLAGDELSIVAKELKMDAKMNLDVKAMTGLKVGGDAKIELKGGGMLKVHGSKTDFMGAGTQAAAKGSASPEDVPDPVK